MESSEASSSPRKGVHYEAGNAPSRSPAPRSSDVFISYRGPDVHETMVTPIVDWLRCLGIRVYPIQELVQSGELIVDRISEVISSASVSIVIFSKRYAESVWCLGELCLTLENGGDVVPVYYDVRPSDLRWIEKGVYANAFYGHKTKARYTLQKIEAWKAALKRVSYLSALELNGPQFEGDRGKLLQAIVDVVFERLKGMPVNVARQNLVLDLDRAVEDFENFLQCVRERENQKVMIVGVVGKSGRGKRTLVREFYNRKHSSFRGSSFLFDVGEASAKNALESLQSKLLEDLVGTNYKINSIGEGKEVLRNSLCSCHRTLIILDNVDHESQVDALIVEDVLMCGSLVIITSRHRRALIRSGIPVLYELKDLNLNHAKEHDLLRDLGREIANEASPCRLWRPGQASNILQGSEGRTEVLGIVASASDRHDSYGFSTGLKLLAIRGNCFEKRSPFGKLTRDLIWLRWYDCPLRRIISFSPMANLRVLELINGDFKCLWRRDFEAPLQLRELNIYSSIRLRKLPDSIGLLKHLEKMVLNGLVNMRALPEEFCNLESLKHLELRNCKKLRSLPTNFENLTNLKYIGLDGCSKLQMLPQFFGQTELKVLDISNCSELERFPPLERLISLEKFIINGCSKIPLIQGIEHLNSLEEFRSHGCRKLQSIHGLEHLTKLQDLDISECSQIDELPSLALLGSLKSLVINGCHQLQRIEGLEHLNSLEEFKSHGCRKLQSLQGLKHLTKLQDLDISECSQMELQVLILGNRSLARLPSSFRNLPSLRMLDLKCFKKLEPLPRSFGRLSSLAHLTMKWPRVRKVGELTCLETSSISAGTRQLKRIDQYTKLWSISIPEDICPSLEHLSLCSNAMAVETLPKTLVKLSLKGCSKLKSLSGISNLSRLQILNLSQCSELVELPSLEHLSSLKNLIINGCKEMQGIEGLEHLNSLEEFRSHGCPINHLSILPYSISGGMRQLKRIDLQYTKLSSISIPEDMCPRLEHLSLCNNEYLMAVETLPKTLVELSLKGCSKLKSLSGISYLEKLRVLDISQCSKLDELPSLEHLSSLKNLIINGCKELQGIEGLEHLNSLEEFRSHGCPISHLTSVLPSSISGGMRQLKRIDLQYTKLSSISIPEDMCPRLEHLSLCNNEYLMAVETLPKTLVELSLKGCSKLKSLSGISDLGKLQELDISECSELDELPSLEHLSSLKNLVIDGCKELQSIEGLEHLNSLEEFRSHGCRKLQSLQGLEHLKKLQDLDISECSQIDELPSLALLSSLKSLVIIGCHQLQSLEGLKHLNSLERFEADNLKLYSRQKTLPTVFCSLKSLEHLELRHFESFRLLPEHFGDLTNLRHVDFSYWENLEKLPESFSHLTRLEYLNLSFCSSLTIQPEIFKNITTLEELNFEYCKKLRVLPIHMTQQGSLRTLNLIDTDLQELPTELGNLSSLEVLRIGSRSLPSLPSSFGNLTSLTMLEMDCCRKLECLPTSLRRLDRLAHLSIKWSGVQEVRQLTCLETLVIWDCPISHLTRILPSSISGGMQHLKRIDLQYTKLSSISIPDDMCPRLEHLSLCNDKYLTAVETLPKTLVELSLKGCSKLKSLSGISDLEKLQQLDISECSELDELPSLEHLSSLKNLVINGCQELQSIEGLAHLTSLEKLEAYGCSKLESMEGLDQLEQLTCLKFPAGNGAIWSCIQRLKRLPEKLSTMVLSGRDI